MKPGITVLTASLAVALSMAAHAQTPATSGSSAQRPEQPKSAQGAQRSGGPDTQRASKEQCDQLQGNAKTICNAEVKAMTMVQDAKEKVAQHDSPQTRLEFSETRADAKFEVAKARCGDLVGDAKKACEDEATAMRDLTKARAKRQALAQQGSSQSTGAGARMQNGVPSGGMDTSSGTNASGAPQAASPSGAGMPDSAGSSTAGSTADTSSQGTPAGSQPSKQPQSSSSSPSAPASQ